MDFSLSIILEILSSGTETMVRFTSTNQSFLMMSHKKTFQTLVMLDLESLIMSLISKDTELQCTPISETMKFSSHMGLKLQMSQVSSSLILTLDTSIHTTKLVESVMS